MSEKKCKDCLHCTVDDDEVLCVDMPWHYPFGGSDSTTLDKEACKYFVERDEPTLFEKITISPEVLASRFIYFSYRRWRSSLLPGMKFWKYPEALDATIEKLKEVCNG